MSETPALNPQERTGDQSWPSYIPTLPASDAGGPVLLERLGVGGMGEVYRYGETALGRDLALKVLRMELRGNADAEERFLREARLTGSLQHPGIVPVHNLGRLADGRLHYTMRLVRGRTFADILKEEAGQLERLPSLLGIFEKVCQAMAYAHSRRVIHRDLKPGNVMVGEFGEVQVMDWGLAKQLHAGAPATQPTDGSASEVETVAWVEEAAELTRAGAAMGTPAYMSPEQAAGDWAIVDERADVFALGAILCQMLTGRTPYQEANRDEVLRRARRGDLAEALARLEQCGADASLVQLCRECLAPEREGRPRNAEAVAKRLAAYQAEVQERLRRAELERARAEVRAQEEHKRRRQTLTLSGAVLLVFVAGTVASTLFGLDARDQAGIATKNAENAVREKRKADEKSREVEEKERIATQAKEDTELALTTGLLRPMGLKTEGLSPAEEGALMTLHNLPSDSLRVRFIEAGLRSAETARRLDRRAAWVIQAAVGLNAGHRRQVEEVLMRRLRQHEAPKEVREACVSLGVALEVRDPSLEDLAGEIIVAGMVNSIKGGYATDMTLHGAIERRRISQQLQAVSGRLDAAHAGKAADALMTVISKTTDADALHSLTAALQAVVGRLDAATATDHANKAADILLATMSETNDVSAFGQLCEALLEVRGRLDAVHGSRAADTLLTAISKTNDTNALFSLCRALGAVGGRLDAAHAQKAADVLLAIMSKTNQPVALAHLSGALGALGGRLDAASATTQAGKVADALLAAISKTTDPNVLWDLSGALTAVGGRLDSAHVQKAVGVVLAAMDKTNRPVELAHLSAALGAVGGRLDAVQATDRLLLEMGRATDPYALDRLSVALRALVGRLDAAHARRAAYVLLAAMSKTNHPVALDHLSQTLQVVCERQHTHDLVLLLEHPLAAGPAQRAVLDILGRRTRHEFRNTWHFLDWAQSGGVDFVPPDPPTPPEGPDLLPGLLFDGIAPIGIGVPER
jgi:hypothetical protein